MIKCKVIEPFTLQRYSELKNIIRAGLDTPGQLNTNDTFECSKDLADYLLGNNKLKKSFIKVIEIIPEEPIVSTKSKIKKTTR